MSSSLSSPPTTSAALSSSVLRASCSGTVGACVHPLALLSLSTARQVRRPGVGAPPGSLLDLCMGLDTGTPPAFCSSRARCPGGNLVSVITSSPNADCFPCLIELAWFTVSCRVLDLSSPNSSSADNDSAAFRRLVSSSTGACKRSRSSSSISSSTKAYNRSRWSSSDRCAASAAAVRCEA